MRLPKNVGALVLEVADATGNVQIPAVCACGVVCSGTRDGFHLNPLVFDRVVLFTAIRNLPMMHLSSC